MMGGATPLIPDGLIMNIYDYCSFYIEAIILMYVCVFYVYDSSINGRNRRFCYKIQNSMEINMSITLLVLVALLINTGMIVG